MLGLGAGNALSAGGRRLIQLATTGALLAGVGLAGFGAYGYSQPNDPRASAAISFAQQNSTLLIAIGVAAVVLGAVVRWWASRRMMKQMMAPMESMMGGMMGGGAMMGMAGAATSVKVRCRACGTLGDEQSKFCGSCGASMA